MQAGSLEAEELLVASRVTFAFWLIACVTHRL